MHIANSSVASTIAVHHVEIASSLPVQRVHERLLGALSCIDPKVADMLRRGDGEAVARERATGPALWLFEVRDMGSLIAGEGRTVRIYQYEIGNPLTAESMMRFQPGAGLYAPLRVVLYEARGVGVFAYDQPSDLFGQFGDERVTQVGRELDHELESVLRHAADTDERTVT